MVLRPGRVERRAAVGAGALTAGFALVSLVASYPLVLVLTTRVGPLALAAALLVEAVAPRLAIGAVVTVAARRRGVDGDVALTSCFLGAAVGAAVLPGALTAYAVLEVTGTTQTWATLAANVVITASTVAAGGGITLRWARRPRRDHRSPR